MSADLRIGVIGTGMMGCEHIRNVQALPGAEVTAISDPNDVPLGWGHDANSEAVGFRSSVIIAIYSMRPRWTQ